MISGGLAMLDGMTANVYHISIDFPNQPSAASAGGHGSTDHCQSRVQETQLGAGNFSNLTGLNVAHISEGLNKEHIR